MVRESEMTHWEICHAEFALPNEIAAVGQTVLHTTGSAACLDFQTSSAVSTVVWKHTLTTTLTSVHIMTTAPPRIKLLPSQERENTGQYSSRDESHHLVLPPK